MHEAGEAEKGAIRPEFNRSVMIDFQGAKITSDAGVIILREVDERFGIIGPMEASIDDSRSPRHTRHTIVQMIRQRVYQIAAGYEDCNDADHLRIDPALRLAIGKDHDPGAGQSMLTRVENGILGNAAGLAGLDEALLRSNDVILGSLDKRRLIIDLDSTEDPAYGTQENVAYNGHFGKNCFHPLFCFTSDGTCLGSKLRPGNIHSANGSVDFIRPIVERYRSWFQLFWLRGDAAFKEGKNTLRWDKTSCHSFDANRARLKMGVLAYNLLHLIREFYLLGEEFRRSIEWLIRRLIKVGRKWRIMPGSGTCISPRPSRPERDPSDWPFNTGRFLAMVRPIGFVTGQIRGLTKGTGESYVQTSFFGDQGCHFCPSAGPENALMTALAGRWRSIKCFKSDFRVGTVWKGGFAA